MVMDTVGAILIMVTVIPIMAMDTLIMDMEGLIPTIQAEEVLLMEAVIILLLLIIGITRTETATTAETTFLALVETAIPILKEHPLLSPIEIVTLPLEIIKDKTETVTTKREQTQTALLDKTTAHQIVTLQVQIIHTEIAVAECLVAVAECLAVAVDLECPAAAEEDNIYLYS